MVTSAPDTVSGSAAVIQIFANADAGSFRSRQLETLRAGLERLGARVLLSRCGPGREPEIAAEASQLCVYGGDGTARHVAAAALDSGRALPIAVYPAGTVNLLAREMFGARRGDDAARIAGRQDIRQHHVAKVNDETMLVCASAGPDSRAVAGVTPALKRRFGKLAYALAFLALLPRWRRDPIRLRWEDGEAECEAFYVAKGRYFAGPWSFAPEASVTDPCLHVVMLPDAGRVAYLRFLFALYRGRAAHCQGVSRFSCDRLEAVAASPVPVQVDGDLIGSLPVTIRIQPQAQAFF